MRFYQLDTLRFFFAAIIVLGHTSGWDKTFNAGGLAVDFFFILSGFVLSFALQKPTNDNFPKFVTSRVSRLFPLYLALLVCMPSVGIITGKVDLLDAYFWQNVFLLQNVIPSANAGYIWPAWSISAELWMNVLILFWIVRFNLIRTSILLVVFGYSVLWYKGLVIHAHNQEVLFSTAGFFRCISGVLSGFIVFRIHRWLNENWGFVKSAPRIYYSALEILLLLLMLAGLLHGGRDVAKMSLLLMPLFILIFAFGKGILSALLSLNYVKSIGNLTYGIYLIHAPLLNLLRSQGIIPESPKDTSIEIGFLILFITTLISIPAYYLLEIPSKKFIMSRLSWLWSVGYGKHGINASTDK